MKDFKKMTKEEIQAIVDREKAKRAHKVLVSGKIPEPKGTETEEVYKFFVRSFLDSFGIGEDRYSACKIVFQKDTNIHLHEMRDFNEVIQRKQEEIQKAEQFFEIEEGMKKK